MNESRASIASHPHFVAIPEPNRVDGIRTYREPAVPHPLQLVFLDPDGERTWVEDMRTLLTTGQITEADARLERALAGFDGASARLCKATRPDNVALEGWDDLLPILAEWEGPSITAITLGLTNAPDLVFEIGRTHEPDMLLGLYSDQSFAFSRASEEDLLAECSKDSPAWVGAEEDVEFHCALSGLAELNTALVQSKHRHFLRDGRDGVEGRAPGGYVEFVLGSWVLATRFLQAVEYAVTNHGLPTDCCIIVGAVDTNADFLTVLGSHRLTSTGEVQQEQGTRQPEFAPLTIKSWGPREEPIGSVAASGQSLRKRLNIVEPVPAGPEKMGLWARIRGAFERR